jgi:hypothetical protein
MNPKIPTRSFCFRFTLDQVEDTVWSMADKEPALKDDLRTIRDHFVRMGAYVICEGIIFLAFRWNPVHFSIEFVCRIEQILSFFMVATILLFTLTAFLLLVRGSTRELLGWPKKREEEKQGQTEEKRQ